MTMDLEISDTFKDFKLITLCIWKITISKRSTQSYVIWWSYYKWMHNSSFSMTFAFLSVQTFIFKTIFKSSFVFCKVSMMSVLLSWLFQWNTIDWAVCQQQKCTSHGLGDRAGLVMVLQTAYCPLMMQR